MRDAEVLAWMTDVLPAEEEVDVAKVAIQTLFAPMEAQGPRPTADYPAPKHQHRRCGHRVLDFVCQAFTYPSCGRIPDLEMQSSTDAVA